MVKSKKVNRYTYKGYSFKTDPRGKGYIISNFSGKELTWAPTVKDSKSMINLILEQYEFDKRYKEDPEKAMEWVYAGFPAENRVKLVA